MAPEIIYGRNPVAEARRGRRRVRRVWTAEDTDPTELTRRAGSPDHQGIVAEVDPFVPQRRFGVLWPMRSSEEVVHPLRVPAHDWHVTGLDVNRGLTAAEISDVGFSGRASASATALS